MSGWLSGSSPLTRPFETVPETPALSSRRLLVVTALRDEALAFSRGAGGRCRPMSLRQAEKGLRDQDPGNWPVIPVVYLGPGRHGVENLERLLSGVKMGPILFCGFAGGLSPEVKAGEILVAGRVLKTGESPTPVQVPEFLSSRYREGMVVTVDRPVSTPHEKARLRAKTGGDVVDMESAGWLSLAASRGIPAWAVRVVSDAWEETLPPEAMSFVDARGETSPVGIVRSILLRPAILFSMARLFPGILRAQAGLRELGARVSCECGPGIFPDRGLR